jgi:hypothetical protein
VKKKFRTKPRARQKPLPVLRPAELRFLASSGAAVAVRRAVPSDAARIVALYNSVAAEGIYITPEAYPWSAEAEKEFIRLEKMRGSGRFLAFLDGEVAAECSVIRHPAPKRRHTANLQIAVLKSCRRAGIGRNLLAHALRWASNEGIGKVTLEVFADNAPAIGLYHSAGFFEEGRRAKQLRIRGKFVDEVLMGIFLKPLD